MLVELVQAQTLARASGDRDDEGPRNGQFGDAGDAGDEFSADIEDALTGDIAQIIDLTDDGDHFAQNSSRRAPIQKQNLSTYMLGNGIRLRPGITVELKDGWGPDKIRFIRIQAIVQAPGTLEVLIRGWGYVRVRELDGGLPRKVNEVAMVARLTSSSQIPWQEQSLIEVSADAVGRKRTLKVTNAPFPEHRYDKGAYSRNGIKWVEEWGPLVCRFRYELYFNDGCDKPCESAIVRIGEDEADPNYRVPDEQNQNRWRGGNVPGGSYRPNGPSLPVVDVESNQPRDVRAANLVPGQRYTAGDVFAGAGGASRGIERAGVQLLFAVDHWCHAAESLRSNFDSTDIHELEVTDVILRKDIRYNPDILHLSPPCQFWSPAHTIAGQNDDQNIAVLFSCTDLIAKFRPRLFTVEQTFGIMHPKFQGFFNRFLQGFTEHGYSVRWKIVPLVNYGVPQLRRRLIMIGAAPGEKLPPLPAPTHNKDGTGGLQPWVTPKSALAPLVRVQPIGLHRPARRFDHRKPRWDPDRLAKTITTSGGQNYHWDGERDFTLLEYAVLQGFPIWHKFKGSYVKKQIGNAFAPSVVQLLYEHLVGWLLEQDG
ncbi:S-adenosyl-L-methionine-dependent methyltransferase, partial [Trichocladium antarcticum]